MEEKKKYNLITVNFSAVEPPKFIEKKNKEYVLFGAKNQWPDYLLDLYNRSAKHKALVDGKVDFVCGRGFKISNDANITPQSRALINAFIAMPNPDESLRELDRQTTFDLEVYGGYYLEAIWSNDSSQIAEVNYIDFRYLRRSVEGDGWFFTENWSARKPENNEDFIFIPDFDVNKRTGSGIISVGHSKDVYPLPSYLPAINMIEADYELSVFDLCNIKNQFQGSYLVNFYNGLPSDEEADEIERQIDAKFNGSENAGRAIINFAEDRDKAAEVIPITPSNLDKQYQVLEDRIDSTLLVGHKVINPILFGWKDGQNGFTNNADEMRVAQEAYQNRYAEPRQEEKAELFNKILAVNGLPQVLEVKPLASITEKLSLSDLLPYLTQDEVREIGGYDPLLTPDSMSKTKFNKDTGEKLLKYFKEVGESEDDFEILLSRELPVECIEEALEVYNTCFAVLEDVTESDLSVLNVLRQNPEASTPEIAEATNLTEAEVTRSLERLEQLGAIELNQGEAGELVRDLTKDGEDTLNAGGDGDQLQLMYKYALRSDAPPLKTRSRDFCVRLMAERKLYTRDEIDTLNNGMGLDVFRFRGGYYNNPETGRTTPWCRHIWNQVVVRRNG